MSCCHLHLPQRSLHSTWAIGIAHVAQALVAGGVAPGLSRRALSDELVASGAQRGAALACLRVGDQLAVAHLASDAPSRSVEATVGVRRAIGACAVDLEREAVVEHARHRAADHGDAAQLPGIVDDTEHELASTRRLMVTVMLGHELARLAERQRHDVQLGMRTVRRHCGFTLTHSMTSCRSRQMLHIILLGTWVTKQVWPLLS